eukprot:m.175524 g.175524  ORF g.175524 m.175524 type:complete len:1311 (+) comp17350_c0_seq2:4566-8498(+)
MSRAEEKGRVRLRLQLRGVGGKITTTTERGGRRRKRRHACKQALQPFPLLRLVRLVRQDRGEPALDGEDVDALALGIALGLVLGDLADSKVLRLLRGKVQAADAGGRVHGEGLGQLDAGLVDVHQRPHGQLLRVVGLRRVAGRRADAGVLDLQQILGVELLVLAVSPVDLAHFLVEELGEGLGQTVGEGLGHDRAVVVVALLKGRTHLRAANAAGHGKNAEVVANARACRGDKVRQAHVRLRVVELLRLLAETKEAGLRRRARLVRVEEDVVLVDRVGGEDAEHGTRLQQLLVHNALQHGLGVVVQLLGLGADGGVVEDLRVVAVRVSTAQLPRLEKRLPVDVGQNAAELDAVEHLDTEEVGLVRRVAAEVNLQLLLAGHSQRHIDAVFHRLKVLLANLLVLLLDVGGKVVAGTLVEQGGHGHDRLGRVQNVHDRVAVALRDLHGGVDLGRGGAADEQRDLHAGALHFLGDIDHLVERGSDEARETDDVGLVLDGGLEDLRAGCHDTEVDDLVVVAAEHNSDNVLANVVHVALDRGNDNNAVVAGLLRGAGRKVGVGQLTLLLHERDEVSDGLLHHAGALDDLRQKHLARAKEVADNAHGVHERALNHVERARVQRRLETCLLRVLFDVLVDALHEGVLEALLHRQIAPGLVLLLGLDRGGVRAGVLQQLLCAVGVAVPQQVLAELHEFSGDVAVDGQHAGVDNAHVHAGLDGVEEEDGMHGLADLVHATEREAEVGDAAADAGARTSLLDDGDALDKVLAVGAVLLHARGDGEDVRVEDDVVRVEVDLLHQNLVAAFTDAHAVFFGGGLSLLVKRHDDDGSAVAADDAGLVDELGLALLQADAVDDALALHAAETGFDNLKVGRVDAERHLGDVRLRGDQVAELDHGLLAVKHALVHVDVDDLGSVLHLRLGHSQGFRVLVRHDEAAELLRASHVAALANVEEVGGGADLGALQAREEEVVVKDALVAFARLDVLELVADVADVVGRSAAAAADNVEQAVARKVQQQIRGLARRLVVRAHGVGQAGVGVADGVGGRRAGNLLDVRAHVLGAKRAVEAETQRLCVRDAEGKGLRGLAAERAAAAVGDGAGDEDGHTQLRLLLKELLHGEDGSLGVERVKDRLDEEDVRAAVEQTAGLLRVGRGNLLKGDVAEGRVLDRGRDGERAVGGAERAADEALALALLLDLVAGLAREHGSLEVQAVDDVLEAVVGLRDRGAAEGVGLDKVRAGIQVGLVDGLDDVRAREGEEVVVALQRLLMRSKLRAAEVLLLQLVLLDGGAHGAIDEEDPLLQQRHDAVANRRAIASSHFYSD